MSSSSSSSSLVTLQPIAPPAEAALTLGAFHKALVDMPKDALVTRLMLAPTFVVPRFSKLEIDLSTLDDINIDAFEGAAAITVYEDRDGPVAASEMAARIEPLLCRHSDRQLISKGAIVTGLSSVSRIVTGPFVATSKLCPGLAETSAMIVKAAEALAKTGKVDDALIVEAMEPVVPAGVYIRLYRVGDRVFEFSDLTNTFPRLTAREWDEIFLHVERHAAHRQSGRLSMWSAPDDITYDMLAAAFTRKCSALDRLRGIVAAAPAVACEPGRE
ncbi:hypothetical protein pdul_cds_887 [Pandoravirus dulcis]|uniref:Uncharacterized protein n=1 Tax=Pandoravirus dulcis TaxID=1349409 RepID=S4VZ28_9VIRU|nr:hypothetical protein pdul_cds_887 [Pandoravirus dulcis]AGO83114.1 hypothetical protein pdul_cds_887 [Pandoravirus dulcis]